MNREKKQFAVIGVLAALILGVGAFQFTRKDAPAPPPATKKETPKPAAEDLANAPFKKKYPDLPDLTQKDPFEIAAFVSIGTKTAPTPPVAVTTPKTITSGPGGTSIPGAGRRAIKRLDGNDPGLDGPLPISGGAGLKPLQPEEPVFGYTCIGIVEGAHPMAVFDDGKGNQQLVEAGQGIGPSATITHISRGTVRVKFNAKTLTFNVGGNPNAK